MCYFIGGDIKCDVIILFGIIKFYPASSDKFNDSITVLCSDAITSYTPYESTLPDIGDVLKFFSNQ